MKDKKFRWLMLILLVVLAISIILGVNIGYAKINFNHVLKIILSKIGFGVDVSGIRPQDFDIIYLIRLPRLILALVVGMSLGVSGLVMQAVVKSPLAYPYVLGISSGATFGATLGITLGINRIFGSNAIGVCAFIGAFAIAIMVVVLSNIGSQSSTSKLLLSGIALSTAMNTLSSVLIFLSSNREASRELTFWLMGSLAGAKWENLTRIAPIIFLCTLVFFTQHRNLDLALLGDDIAITMGVNLNKLRHIYLLIISIMIGFVVYVSGIIGFIGLIIPHVARFIVGNSHKKLVFLSAILGSILLIWADIASRVLIPSTELPTGVVVALIGAPLFIYLIITKSFRRN